MEPFLTHRISPQSPATSLDETAQPSTSTIPSTPNPTTLTSSQPNGESRDPETGVSEQNKDGQMAAGK